jgi:peptidoglycan/xylan/chitin deacetylase (PgdA/CDA1 family)
VPLARFQAQLDHLQSLQAAVVDVACWPAVPAAAGPVAAFTFDDGHASNAQAAELLARRRWPGTLFVNPSTVGQPNMLSWATLADLASAGISVQSHGMHHRFLDELSRADALAELVDSRRAIEDKLGLPVTVYAPAGGRLHAQMPALLGEAGYGTLCTSQAGLWAASAPTRLAVPRMAMLAGTSLAQFDRWVRADAAELWRQRVRHGGLALAKRMLGNDRYVRWRGALLGGRAG